MFMETLTPVYLPFTAFVPHCYGTDLYDAGSSGVAEKEAPRGEGVTSDFFFFLSFPAVFSVPKQHLAGICFLTEIPFLLGTQVLIASAFSRMIENK